MNGTHYQLYRIPYSGKFTKGFIFENFENIQAFSKIFFRNIYLAQRRRKLFRAGGAISDLGVL